MKTLIVMRHAKSSWSHPGLSDHDRPLNGRGRRSARAMGDWLRRHGYLPDTIVSSSSLRTRQTCEGLRLQCSPVYDRELYHASAEEMLEVLRAQTGTRVLMLGHNPGIAEFAGRIVSEPPDHPRFDDYPTCATLVASFDIADWADARWGDATARAFVVPRDLTD